MSESSAHKTELPPTSPADLRPAVTATTGEALEPRREANPAVEGMRQAGEQFVLWSTWAMAAAGELRSGGARDAVEDTENLIHALHAATDLDKHPSAEPGWITLMDHRQFYHDIATIAARVSAETTVADCLAKIEGIDTSEAGQKLLAGGAFVSFADIQQELYPQAGLWEKTRQVARRAFQFDPRLMP